MKKYIQDATLKLRDLGMPYFGFPGREHDLLFRREYRHPDEGEDCSNCDRTQIVDRDPRPDDGPSIHYGLIASADLTMQDPKCRDALRKSEKVLCFEKEAAGLMDRFPCIAIRGISDYADTHKCKKWQPYAAVAAAAYAKDLLAVIQPHDVARDTAAAQVLEQSMDTKYRHEIMGWLSTLDFKTEQEDLLSRSVFIGKWLLESDEFMRWVKGSRWQLRCYGEAGTGKTNFCAIVIHHLQKTFGLKRPVIYLYLSDDEHKRVKQTLDNLLGSMLKQLISCGPNVDIPQKLIDAYEGLGNGAYSTREIMKQALQDLVAKQERVYLIVDGLNQCFPEVSELIKEYALGLVQDGLPLSLLTTSLGRQNLGMYVHCDCDDGQFDLCLDCKKQGIVCPKNHDGEEPYDTVRIEVRARYGELEEYCREMISRALKTGRDRRDERVHPPPKYNPRSIARYLRDKPGLLWLQNLFESKEPENDKGVLRFLDKIPEKCLAAYVDERIAKLKRYRKENALHIAFTALALIMSACRYLTILQLQHALALHSDQVIESTLNDRTFILWSANGLITIDKAEESCSFVRFFHGTLPAVLAKSDHHPFLKRAEYEMAKTCLKYLQDEQSLSHYENPTAYPFLPYALRFWGDHVRKANDQEIDKEAVRLLKHHVHLARLIRQAAKRGPKESAEWIHEAMDVLHICAWFGLTNIVSLLIAENHDVGIRDHIYSQLLKHNTPVEEEAVIDAMCGLICAKRLQGKQEKRQEIVRRLLQTGNINLNARLGAKSRTVLMLAVGHGHYDFVDEFLGHKSIDVNAQDSNGFTALSFAVYSEEGVSIDSFDPVADNIYLSRCDHMNKIRYKEYKCQGLVRLLLQQGANPNVRDNASNSTLILAIRLGALDIVETLLKCERLNLESEKELIHTASAMGYPEIIRLLHSALSQTNKIHIYNIDTRDERALTPLHYASLLNSARAGEVTEVLLELGADPNLADDRGCTPYMMASLLQHTQVMEVLQSNVTSPNGETRDTQDLPALTLAEHDHWALLREVITTGRADLTYKCMLSGDTLLHMATAANESDILRLLIESKLRPESAVNEQGHTPLHLARTVEFAKLLVDDGYHVDSTDLNNNTPLDIARRQRETRDVADYLEDVSRMSDKKHRTETWEGNTKGEKLFPCYSRN
ncbi:hypothetical protein BDV30DRAFT_251862 [Aspergillus minisclerotigenes]|uniref:Nephrocystin 3-like N-terminal domain-containing protein n=1 Tax=Aspergillus minisclerotigenes TaxID=656917 RepID=A0A5N6IRC4_9EURO|nr:hypothetical protein BDV30DRAFT_251862 [Aspergillus minisclerotigenes]